MNDTPKPTIRPNGSSLRDSQGWDGKLRMDKRAIITNAEVHSDAEYSDEDAPAVEQIGADEGQRVRDAFDVLSADFRWGARSFGRLRAGFGCTMGFLSSSGSRLGLIDRYGRTSIWFTAVSLPYLHFDSSVSPKLRYSARPATGTPSAWSRTDTLPRIEIMSPAKSGLSDRIPQLPGLRAARTGPLRQYHISHQRTRKPCTSHELGFELQPDQAYQECGSPEGVEGFLSGAK